MRNPGLTDLAASMKSLGDLLVPQTFPNATFEQEQEVLVLKQRYAHVDGYELILCYSKADYKNYWLESLQIQSTNGPFLPLSLLCKIGKEFFGDRPLSYLDFFRDNKKVYCWAIKHSGGRVLVPPRCQEANFEGYHYFLLDPGSVDLH